MAPKASRRTQILLDAAVIFLLTAALIWPLFKAKYLANWGSIESTYIADARFLVEHWPHPQWQPLWYTGTRLDYVYPPALRYGTALIARAVGYWPVKAYHVYIALFYCLGMAGVYLLIRAGTGSRGSAWLGAAATALLSPSFLFLKLYRQDSPMWTPQRLHGMVQYGEGAHMAALALIPIALAFTWRALQKRRPADIAWAAGFAAAAVSNNFYGATALALCYAVLAASFWITRRERQALVPLAAIPILAYGLTAFWLVPSYFRITAANLQYVAMPGNAWSVALMLAVAAAFAWSANRLAGRRPERTWAVFGAGLVVFFSLSVAGNYFFGFRILGEPLRMAPELDLVLILAAVTGLAALWRKRRVWARAAAAAIAICGFATAGGYVRHAWQAIPLAGNYWERPEYRIADWVAKYMPDARVFPVGSVRFWYDAWHDLAQLGGGSEQGLENDLVEHAQWALRLSPSLELSLGWLQSMAVDAVYVPGPGSLEVYKTDYVHPGKYAGCLEVIYDDHQGNVLYRVPRRYAARARVVETRRLKALQAPRDNWDLANVRAYADVVEHGPEAPPRVLREGSDALRVQAQVAAGQSLVVQESYDPAWRAWSSGRAVRIHPDAMGMMAMEPPPGDAEIQLQFMLPVENRIGWGLTGVALIVTLVLLAQRSQGGGSPTSQPGC